MNHGYGSMQARKIQQDVGVSRNGGTLKMDELLHGKFYL